MSTQNIKRWNLLPFVAVVSFAVATFCLAPRVSQLWWQAESPVLAAVGESSKFITKPIEHLRPGERVLAGWPRRGFGRLGALAQEELINPLNGHANRSAKFIPAGRTPTPIYSLVDQTGWNWIQVHVSKFLLQFVA